MEWRHRARRSGGPRPSPGVETDASGERWRVAYDGERTLAEGLVVTSRTVRKADIAIMFRCFAETRDLIGRPVHVRDLSDSIIAIGQGSGGWNPLDKVLSVGSVTRSDGGGLIQPALFAQTPRARACASTPSIFGLRSSIRSQHTPLLPPSPLPPSPASSFPRSLSTPPHQNTHTHTSSALLSPHPRHGQCRVINTAVTESQTRTLTPHNCAGAHTQKQTKKN